MKPIFKRFCKCVEWDDDYALEQDPAAHAKGGQGGPPSRRMLVHDTYREIKKIQASADNDGGSIVDKTSKVLSDVCDPDERMNQVLQWSAEQGKLFVDQYRGLYARKQEDNNDEVWIQTAVVPKIKEEEKDARQEMEEAKRQMQYAIIVREKMAIRDQDTLARYILTLEAKIQQMTLDKHALHMEVHHLRAESQKMRYTDEELKENENDDIKNETQSVVDVDQGERSGADRAAGEESSSSTSNGSSDSDSSGEGDMGPSFAALAKAKNPNSVTAQRDQKQGGANLAQTLAQELSKR